MPPASTSVSIGPAEKYGATSAACSPARYSQVRLRAVARRTDDAAIHKLRPVFFQPARDARRAFGSDRIRVNVSASIRMLGDLFRDLLGKLRRTDTHDHRA